MDESQSPDAAALLRATLRYVVDHIDEPLTLGTVAEAVGSSSSGLHRVFWDLTGRSPGSFIRTLRMELALRSLQDRERSVLEVALSAGFSDHSAFSRSFRQVFGFAPRQARERHNIVRDLEHVVLEEPDLIDVEPLHALLVTESGRYHDCAPRAWQRLAGELPHAISEDDAQLFVGIAHDNPHSGSAEPHAGHVRFSAGLLAPASARTTQLAGGPHARFRFRGFLHNSGLALHYIYGRWADSSERSIAQRPCLMLFDSLPIPAREMELHILVPLDAEVQARRAPLNGASPLSE
ncbi:MAG TPA: AraC family transcriptional regulator [Polyangiales bacterium]|nr:AraC family transcriptional regulator [Polyangiales bacterium]